ncbi:hypothetical protein KM043_005597 [Ampulex compressa]|nr:hypothetical protein KM043_005597 [Ampulex compressa]
MIVPVNPQLLKLFGFWGSVLILKVMAMVALTGRQRFGKKVFANVEDLMIEKKGKVVYDDPDVERVRRAHLNDLENIIPWFLITYLWLTTGPSVWLARILFQTFTFARLIHTLVYAIFPQQPLRAISFFVGFGVMGYEAVSTLLYYY